MKDKRITAPSLQAQLRQFTQEIAADRPKRKRIIGLGLMVVLSLPGLVPGPVSLAQSPRKADTTRLAVPSDLPNAQGTAGKTVTPTPRTVEVSASVNVQRIAAREALEPFALQMPGEIRAIQEPKGDRPINNGVPIILPSEEQSIAMAEPGEQAPLASATGVSPAPSQTFKAEFLSGLSIPPDTMGAVGTTHIVTVSNDRMRIQTRDGVEISRITLTSFWAGVTIKGVAIAQAFDPKIYFDRFNGRFILISSGNGQNVNSGAMFAVSATADPTGTWYRYSVAADPASTAAGGHWIDYPSVGFNKNWIIVNENVFNYGTAGTGYWGQQVYVLDKQAAYSNTISSMSIFEGNFSTQCVPSATQSLEFACGFTMAPTIVEDNTTNSAYLVEDWDSTAGQLRVSKLTGTAAAPVLTVGTQFPQSANSWVFNAQRISGTTGGYVPQRQQFTHLPSSTRIMTNDSRIQNAVLRNGKLWTTQTVMLSSTPTPAGAGFGAANPDNHSAVQWWQIDPSIENSVSSTPALQRGRIEDPTANNCHNGTGGILATPPCNSSTGNQVGQFYAFPNISVNQNNDVLIGFTQFSAFTYPSSGYAFRAGSDPVNTMRDAVVFRPGQANYNIGGGSGATRQNRWGDYSATQTDPLNDTDFWIVQEYAGVYRNLGLASLAGPWETWWAKVSPTGAVPSKTGNLIISEFRLRGPQGPRDEYIELYNPDTTPVVVNTTDNSEGWAVASSDGTTTVVQAVIPNGTVIPGRGHFLIANNPDNVAQPTAVYSLNMYSANSTRGADSDLGYHLDIADNSGLAIFKTSVAASFSLAKRMDAVGFDNLPTPHLFKEGNGMPAIATTAPTGQVAFFRSLLSGTPRDTDDNRADFQFVDPENEVFGTVPQLGAAGPENLSSPIQKNGSVTSSQFDLLAPLTAAPNRVRNTADTGTNKTFGTITVRRKFKNNTGGPVKQLRFRVADITTYPTPDAATADVRALSVPGQVIVSLTGGGTATVEGTALETPPTQSRAGGYNSTLVVNLASPLAAGSSVNVQWVLGVETKGNFRFYINTEAQ